MKQFYPLKNHSLFMSAKQAGMVVIALFFFIQSYSQTTNISGVVNSYYKVVDIVPAKACVILNTVAGLSINSRVMIVQMKGAAITTANDNTFGTVSALNDAGNYEIATICNIHVDSVFFFHTFLNTYAPSQSVQLVQFAEYSSANVIDTVKASPWNSVTGTGGVIAIYTDQDLTLNAPIYADSAGYRGGGFLLHSGNCTDGLPAPGYVYNGNSTGSFVTGAFKGESITTLTAGQSGGRGAPANGGGGGNNHNNSGGGGANLSAGGRGGGNSSNSVPCTLPFQGEGGRALNNASGMKIYMGGGGGAGNSNGGLFTKGGGNGGGIIFLWVGGTLTGNNKTISANGAIGGQSQSDGAGGGGAGGTIIMQVTTYSGALAIRAHGGDGGTSNDAGNTNRCFGGGGGGSGGVIYFTTGLPAVTSTAYPGLAGLELSRHTAGCLPPVPAVRGDTGQVISSYILSLSLNPAGFCTLILPSGLMTFTAAVSNKKVLLRWKALNPDHVSYFIAERKNTLGEWVPVQTVNANDQQQEYSSNDNNPDAGNNLYRLKVIEKNNAVSYSDIRKVFVDYSGNDLTVFPNPASTKINITGKFKLPADVKVIDLSGKLILQKQIVNNPSELDLSGITTGVYMLHINQSVIKLMIR